MENKKVCQGNTRVHKPAKFNVNTRRMAMVKRKRLLIRLSKQRKSTDSSHQKMTRMFATNTSPSLELKKLLILELCIEFIKRRKPKSGVCEKQEREKIRMLLRKMDIILQVLELKWKIYGLLEKVKASRGRG